MANAKNISMVAAMVGLERAAREQAAHQLINSIDDEILELRAQLKGLADRLTRLENQGGAKVSA
jgi:ABC-type Fe3+-hydroxamate transport system substrate-binding protein